MARGLVKAAGMPIFPEWMRYSFSSTSFRALAQEGYRGNGGVFGCISALAFAFPEPPLLVWQETAAGKAPLRNHALSMLLKRPNPQMGLAELLQYTMVYMAVGGNCYWYKVRSRAGRVVELWPLHDGQMTPKPGTTRLIDHYELDMGTGTPERIEASEVVHHKWMPDPLAPHKGLGPMIAVAREVDTDNEATRYLFALLKNDAMPRLAFVVPPGVELSQDQRDRFNEEWKDRHGVDKRGGVALLEGGVDVKTIATNLRELEFNALRRVPEARMSSAFRVPAIIAGLYVGLERSTLANYAEARTQFAEDTLVPMWSNLADEASTDLLPDFAGRDDEIVEFDLAKVQALQRRVMERRKWALEALRGGGLLVNEFRAACDLPPDENGDVYLRGQALQAVPARLMIAAPGAKGIQPSPLGERAMKGAKRRKEQTQIIDMQRAERRLVGGRMEVDLDRYFAELADRVVRRAREKALTPDLTPTPVAASPMPGKSPGTYGGRGENKDLPNASELITPQDNAELGEILKRFTIELVQLSWGTWNAALQAEVAFDLTDPAVTELLDEAGTRIKQISETTLHEVRDLLKLANDNGWSIDHLVRGDPASGTRGLRDLVAQTYKGRARTIARTELGNAQNRAAYNRFFGAGVTKVYVLDDGIGDEDEPCVAANQTVKPIEWMVDNLLEHPNCTRAFAPEF